MFTIEVALLEPVYEASLDSGPEWPPHPDRVYCALVGVARPGTTDDDALRWLEQQPPPEVFAPAAIPSTLSAYVPTNAVQPTTKSNRVGRTNGERIWHRHHLAGNTVIFRWPDAVPDPMKTQVLRNLAERVPYLGRASSPALLSVSDADTHPGTLTPLVPRADGSNRLRVPYAGKLAALRDAYEAGDAARTTARWTFYGPPIDHEPPVEAVAPAYPDLLTLAFPSGSALDGRLAVRIATAFRKAVLQRLGTEFNEEELALVHGHRPTNDIRRQCAFLCLPFVGGPHATGQIHGVAVALSPDLSPDVRLGLLRAAGMSLDHAGIPALEIPGLATLALSDPVAAGDRRLVVDRDRWTRPSRTWTTALPIVLDRYPKSLADVPAHVTEGCLMAGYPAPDAVEHLAQPLLQGVPRFRRSDLRRRRSDPARPAVHVRLRFADPVPGPVVIGNMRHLGLGLCAPVGKENP
ncbi:MAG: type I-G CRISPR-associated protein Csb2 [Euzebya sp.]